METTAVETKQSPYKDIVRQGLWKNNPGLVQLLGLCPLLAVTSSLSNALGLGLATMLVLLSTNTVVSLIRNFVPNEIRIPVFVMVIASVVTVIELLMHAFMYNLYQALGIFIPLIVTNCIVIGRAEAYASKNAVLPAAFQFSWDRYLLQYLNGEQHAPHADLQLHLQPAYHFHAK